MAYTEARRNANRKWDAQNVERFGVNIPKGMKEIYKAAAAEQDLSLNAWVRQAIEEKLDQQVSE